MTRAPDSVTAGSPPRSKSGGARLGGRVTLISFFFPWWLCAAENSCPCVSWLIRWGDGAYISWKEHLKGGEGRLCEADNHVECSRARRSVARAGVCNIKLMLWSADVEVLGYSTQLVTFPLLSNINLTIWGFFKLSVLRRQLRPPWLCHYVVLAKGQDSPPVLIYKASGQSARSLDK